MSEQLTKCDSCEYGTKSQEEGYYWCDNWKRLRISTRGPTGSIATKPLKRCKWYSAKVNDQNKPEKGKP